MFGRRAERPRITPDPARPGDPAHPCVARSPRRSRVAEDGWLEERSRTP